MKLLVFLALVTFASAQQKYVWDYLKPALTADEVMNIMTSRGNEFPMYNGIPQTGFDCNSKKQPGFYADPETQCQVFHRCDLNGNMTSYICVNSTVFNQVTLVCDYWFNVDCSRSQELENFANSRLYTDQDLFDTPPADYVIPGTAGAAAAAPIQAPGGQQQQKKPAAAAAGKAGGAKAGGTAQISNKMGTPQAGANAQGQNTLTVAVVSPQAANAASQSASSSDQQQAAQ
ncbi:uncharacterized protein LOC129599931 [Paramacrobiotus metropolitanus]|uniref:uncharacterized protein LOC129599931 n=1 Tax=Paramacrobiotus metropolitanus TaxID=2943436 RepID=UPI002446138F|nr:uncharacterized protein LOC129599931 [Paramacrobiotus metropolitanus]